MLETDAILNDLMSLKYLDCSLMPKDIIELLAMECFDFICLRDAHAADRKEELTLEKSFSPFFLSQSN